jgi:signal transduction histidine kinase
LILYQDLKKQLTIYVLQHVITGAGLGLSITKKIIEANSGTMPVSSELGKGSTFIVSLPKIEE